MGLRSGSKVYLEYLFTSQGINQNFQGPYNLWFLIFIGSKMQDIPAPFVGLSSSVS